MNNNRSSSYIECTLCKKYTLINELHFFQGNENNRKDNEYIYQIDNEEEEDISMTKSSSFIKQGRQSKINGLDISEYEQINEANTAANYHNEEKVENKKQQQLLSQNQLKYIKQQQHQYQNQQYNQHQNQQQSHSPKQFARCQSETKISKPQLINNNHHHPQVNASQLQQKQNPRTPNSYLNIFSSRQNQQPTQQQEQRSANCITPEKITEKILDISSSESKHKQKSNSKSPHYIYQEPSVLQSIGLKHKINSCERNTPNNITLNKECISKIQQTPLQLQSQAFTQQPISHAELAECAEHKESYSLFCETDKKLCCVNCIYRGSGHHKNHNVIPLKQSFNLLKMELNNFKQQQKDKLHQIDEGIRIQSNNKSSMLKTFFSYKELVNKEFQRLISLMQQRQTVVLEEINQTFSQKLLDAEENLRLLQEIKSEFKEFKEFENTSKNGNFLQQVQTYAIKQKLSKSLKVFDGISIIENTKEEINSFDFQSKHSIILEINQLGRIKSCQSTKNQMQKQAPQKSGSSYFNAVKQSTTPVNQNKTTLIDGDTKDTNEFTSFNETCKRNQDIKQGLNAAGIRASLETPSGHNSITSRQRCVSNQQRSISPQSSLSQIQKLQHSFVSQKETCQNQQNNQIPSQLDQMNIFDDKYSLSQNTVQTDRQQSSNTSKKSFMFNEKPPLNVLKKLGQYQNNQENEMAKMKQKTHESEQKNKQNKGYNSQIQQGLFISNEGQLLLPTHNYSSKASGLLSESSQQQQVVFQTQSGSYSTKKTQYSSNSQSGAAKFSSLSAQIKQITQNVPDNYENDYDDEVIQILENDKENAFQEPEGQMTYLSSVNSRKGQQPKLQASQSYSNISQNQEKQLSQQKIYSLQNKEISNTNLEHNRVLSESNKNNHNNLSNSMTPSTHLNKQFEDKPTNIAFNQMQNNTTLPLPNSNSSFLNTNQTNNNQIDYQTSNRVNSHLHNSIKNNIQNSGNTSSRRGVGNKFLTNESLENSNEGNQELIQQLNEEIMYENFVMNNVRDDKDMQISGHLIESMNLKENIAIKQTFKSPPITQIQSSIKDITLQTKLFNSLLLDAENREKLLSILPFKINQTNLLYSTREDKLSSDIFHEKCDGRGPYIVLVKANSFIFGYYSPISFVKCDKYITCSNSFIFTLNNIYNTPPMIFPVKQDKKFIALYQSIKNPCLGSTLQNKQDLWINFDEPRNSYSCLGYAYKLEGQFDGNKILAGQYTDWNVQGIEVFNVVT